MRTPSSRLLGISTKVSPLVVSMFLFACSGSGQPEAGWSMPPPQVSVLTVKAADLPVTHEYVGQTAGSREVEIRARVNGILEQRLYIEGAIVKAGQPLFLIDPKPYEVQLASAEAELAAAQARTTRAEQESKRAEALMSANASSGREHDDAVAELAGAKAAVKLAQSHVNDARLQVGYAHVTAPIAGVSGIAAKMEGALVNASSDSLLTTVVQTDPMFVHFSVSENDDLRQQQDRQQGTLKKTDNEQLQVHVKLSDGRLLDRIGKINFADVRVDSSTGSIAMRATLPNADGSLRAGQFVRVVVSGQMRPDAISVPQSAVLEGPQGKYVYVVAKGENDSSIAEIRNVQVGEWIHRDDDPSPEQWIVRSGLKNGDQVILDNLIKVRPGAPVQLADAAAKADDAAPKVDAAAAVNQEKNGTGS